MVLWKNNRRDTDTQPEYKGSALVNGVEVWVSAWVNTSHDGGTKYFSLKFTPKDQQPAKPAPAPAPHAQPPAPIEPDPVDDLPF